MSDGPLWSRSELVELFEALASRLAARGVTASVYVVQGAAISMTFDARRATRDIDAVVLDGHGALMDEVRRLASERGLPTTWLNEQATAYVSRQPDSSASIVFDRPGLKVATASAAPLFAMKMAAARATDVDDIRLLAGVLNITSISDAVDVFERVFPGQTLGTRQRLVTEDALVDLTT